MTTKDEALRLALEALEVATTPLAKDRQEVLRAQAACREALAQPAGERGELVQDIHLIQTKMVGSMLFDQTDVAVLSKAAALLSSDAQPSEWVGLSDEEINKAYGDHATYQEEGMVTSGWVDFARAIEARLREKNAGKPVADDNSERKSSVEFLMRGKNMAFKIGNQMFTLNYEPDEPEEFEFMEKALLHAISTITPDVKNTFLSKPAAADKAGGDEPVALPCCGYADGSAIKWNPYNGVVQCHNCGQVYTSLQPQAEINSWSVLAARALDDAHRVLETIEPESSSEADNISELSKRVQELFVQALVLHGFKTRKEMDAAKHFNRLAIETAKFYAGQKPQGGE